MCYSWSELKDKCFRDAVNNGGGVFKMTLNIERKQRQRGELCSTSTCWYELRHAQNQASQPTAQGFENCASRMSSIFW
jgi:hypothetical protein